MTRTRDLLEAYGDAPVEVIRNGLLGVARAKKLGKLPKDQKEQQVKALVSRWVQALLNDREAIEAWLVGKL